jgi:uncharacterized protein YfdQ (DUF2303 family)
MSEINRTEADAGAELALKQATPQIAPNVPGLEHPIIVFPRGESVKSLAHLMAPTRKKAKVTVHDYQSFIAYVKKHREPGRTALFAVVTETAGVFTAVLDYHEENTEIIGKPQYGDHVCVLEMRHTPEWVRWVNNSGTPKSQVDMAQFLEDNRLDIKEPEAAKIIEIAKTFEATQGVSFKGAVRLQNGDRRLDYNVQTGARAGEAGNLEIPERIELSLPIYVNGPEYGISAWFRYSIDNGVLRLRYELIRPHKFIELALAEAGNAIEKELEMTLHKGRVDFIGDRCEAAPAEIRAGATNLAAQSAIAQEAYRRR